MQKKSLNQIRCPVCNKFGNKKNPTGLCNKCYEEGKRPKCMIHNCDNDAYEMNGAYCRYCKKHHFGEGDAGIDLFRKNFNSEYEIMKKETPEQYEIVSDSYPIEK